MDTYLKSCFQGSKSITNNYSTSFSLGIRMFSKKYRDPIYAIYAYVRLADEIVDSFHSYDRKNLLNNFRDETFSAISAGVSVNPVIHAFQKIVRDYNIELSYITAFLDSMEKDLYNDYYEKNAYDKYIFGSAEVVGLMCLKVFVNGSQDEFDKLLGPAQSLGSAFQKVNFLRDIKSDIEERNRIYLPGINDIKRVDNESKKILEREIESEFNNALDGIRQLPDGVRLGVYTAYIYYLALFKKIKRANIDLLLKKRVRISDSAKILLLIKSFFTYRFPGYQ
jgi:15-cis-phytoene synthase